MSYDDNQSEEWDDSLLALCGPEHFKVEIIYQDVIDLLAARGWTADQLVVFMERMAPKLDMVRGIASKLAGNMMKGTLKYKRDTWSADTWLAYLEDDATDTLNYVALLKHARSLERVEAYRKEFIRDDQENAD